MIAAEEEVVPSILALLRVGANIDLESKSGLTPLITAAAHGKARSVEVLLKMGASVAFETRDGKTAAIEAIKFRQRGSLLVRIGAAGKRASVFMCGCNWIYKRASRLLRWE